MGFRSKLGVVGVLFDGGMAAEPEEIEKLGAVGGVAAFQGFQDSATLSAGQHEWRCELVGPPRDVDIRGVAA
jgi:hypothetical protein